MYCEKDHLKTQRLIVSFALPTIPCAAATAENAKKQLGARQMCSKTDG